MEEKQRELEEVRQQLQQEKETLLQTRDLENKKEKLQFQAKMEKELKA